MLDNINYYCVHKRIGSAKEIIENVIKNWQNIMMVGMKITCLQLKILLSRRHLDNCLTDTDLELFS